MPALPEVEVLRRDLEKEVVGRRIKDAEVRPGSNAMKIIGRHGRRKDFEALCVGAKVERIQRRGKRLVFELDNAHVLVVNLGNSGSLLKRSASDDFAPHTHVVFSWTIGGQLRIVDPKRTSEVFCIAWDEFEKEGESRPGGLDPLETQRPMTWHQFSAMLEAKAKPLKALLMDEEFVVGLGDLYSDEVLFASALRYDRLSDKLTSQDVRRLYRALMETLQEAVKARGTSWGPDGFVDLQGAEGQFQLDLKVFERDGEPCRRCRNTIERTEIDGYVTYFCPQCQA